jgi:membrane protein DedA with SNARE-associated domain
MDIAAFSNAVVEFVRANQFWGPVIVGLLAFGESVVILSFFVPAVGILFALGAVAGAAGGVAFLPLWIGIVVGASLGNLISWWVGVHYGPAFLQWKPIRERPNIVKASHDAFEKYGFLAIFMGRFFGPLHGTVATIAAIAGMNPLVFHVCNWLSAGVWGAAILYGGMMGGETARQLLGG